MKLHRHLSFVCVSVVLAHAAWIMADDEPLFRWQLNREYATGSTVSPQFGSVGLSSPADLQFDVLSPQAAIFNPAGETKQFLIAGTGLKSLDLPRVQLTAEAWVRVDKPLEWGGFFGVIQDNGDYERGWLLGYRKSQFFFGLVSEKNKRITYLTSPVPFEIGHWYHVAGTWNGTQQSLYVDGELVAASRSQAGNVVYPEKGHFGVGAYWDDSEYYPLTGQVEQVSLWNHALSAEALANRFNLRKSRFPGIEAVHPDVVDWPTHLRDNQRTGLAPDVELNLPLKLKWTHKTRKKPAPAWPPPAHHDFWNRKHGLKARVTFDRSCPVIAVGDSVFYASSAEDQVVCLDRESGKVRWRYFAEAPVRLAPTYDHGRVLFGSDDGCVYCVSAGDGSLLWKHRLVEIDRQIAGNGRVISVWPVRSGILVDDGKAFFCAGLFPEQGIFQAAVEIATGKLIARNAISVSAQGYLERKGSRLHVATGRDPAGSFVSTLSRRGKGIGKEVRSIPEKYPYAFVGDSQSRFAGGHNEVAAFDAESGATIWHATVDGHAHSMAISQSCLLVSTDEGMIYCFGESTGDAVHHVSQSTTGYPWKSDIEREATAKIARKAIDAAGTRQGWSLILNSGDGALAAELAMQSDFKIVCVEDDAESIATSRSRLDAMGLSGRVVVHEGASNERFPYTDYLFNLVVDAAAQQGGNRLENADEAKRVTRPHGGVAILGPTPDEVFSRGPLPGVGEWTHQYADPGNTVCSGDTLVKGDMRLQWFGAPGPRGMMDRHHRTAAPLWANGRLFVPGDNRVVAADAYNGTPLWSIDVPESRRAGVYRDCSYLAASGDSLYVSAAARCLHIDAQTGKQLKAFAVPNSNDESVEWGYLATVDDLLFGSRQKRGSTRRDHSRDQIEEGTYFDARPLVCSDEFFALERNTGDIFWKYRASSGPIVNSTIAVADGRVYFVESTDDSLSKSKTGRHKAATLFRLPAQLTAIDMRTGSLLWKKPIDLQHIEHTIYLSAVKDRILINGSFNKPIAGKSMVHVDVSVFNAEDGSRIWQRTQNNQAKANGAHGEQDLHPVIVGNSLYCEPFAYDLQTGKPLADWKWNTRRRRGCGTISASASTFFFRHSHPTMFDLTGNSYSKITTSTRPGCWINMIPAGGLLLIPEGSSGCSCNYAIQSSMAFLPFGK